MNPYYTSLRRSNELARLGLGYGGLGHLGGLGYLGGYGGLYRHHLGLGGLYGNYGLYGGLYRPHLGLRTSL